MDTNSLESGNRSCLERTTGNGFEAACPCCANKKLNKTVKCICWEGEPPNFLESASKWTAIGWSLFCFVEFLTAIANIGYFSYCRPEQLGRGLLLWLLQWSAIALPGFYISYWCRKKRLFESLQRRNLLTKANDKGSESGCPCCVNKKKNRTVKCICWAAEPHFLESVSNWIAIGYSLFCLLVFLMEVASAGHIIRFKELDLDDWFQFGSGLLLRLLQWSAIALPGFYISHWCRNKRLFENMHGRDLTPLPKDEPFQVDE